MPPVAKPILTLLCLALCAVAVAACGSTASTSSFKGEQHEVAQTIANLQSDATAAEQKKICAKDVAASVVSRLGGTKGCETAFKNQLPEVDTLEVTVESVQIASGGNTATARVQSTYGGKKKITTVSLLKEGKAWKLTSIG
jgi:hypothetical protein